MLPQQEALLPFHDAPVCAEKDFFGHEKLSNPMAYEAIFEPKEDWWTPSEDSITFSVPSLNLAAACVRQYLATRETTEWFHLQVYGVDFDAFCGAMEADGGVTVLLPYWCWCNGGRHSEASFRQHRHVLAVSPRGHFIPNVWEAISRGSAYKMRIRDPLHLLNTLGYLGRRESLCHIAVDVQTNLNHFYINHSLPSAYKWVLACLWEGGLEELFHQEYRHCPVMELVPFVIQSTDSSSYQVEVKDLPDLPDNFVLPVAKHFEPTKRVTRYVLHFMGDRKLCFQKGDNDVSSEEWIQMQARGGNVMSRILANEWWTPTPTHQYYLNIIVPLVARKAELEKEIEKLQQQVAESKRRRRKRKSVGW